MSTAGRRPGDNRTRQAILDAAKRAFGGRGYGATSLRAIAKDAGVDPALVLHFFGTKEQLFQATLELPVNPAVLVAALLAAGDEGLGERLVLTFLGVWDASPGQGPMLAMLRSAVSSEEFAAMLRELLLTAILRPLTEGADEPDRRAGLIASQIIGLAVVRYVLRIEPVASATPAELAPVIGRTIQRYLRDPLD